MISEMKEKATLLGGLAPAQPLAARMRPTTLDEVVGQVALIGPGAPLRRLLERGEAPSLLLWGPPGSGKSTLAAVIATSLKAVPTSLSATSDGVAEVRKAVAAAIERREHGEQTLLFIDELHRFSRTQQDALLPHVEAGTIILVGATTEAPPRAISPALLSRMRTFRLAPLSSDDLETLLNRALTDPRGLNGAVQVDADARRQLVGYASGDARRLLTLLEMAALMRTDGKEITPREVLLAAQDRSLPYDQSGVTSALIKSIRGNDPDAAIWWLATALEGGEDPRVIARRLLVSASEDVGNADPAALPLAAAAAQVVELAGSPECDWALAQAVLISPLRRSRRALVRHSLRRVNRLQRAVNFLFLAICAHRRRHISHHTRPANHLTLIRSICRARSRRSVSIRRRGVGRRRICAIELLRCARRAPKARSLRRVRG
jgi:putative ATPase